MVVRLGVTGKDPLGSETPVRQTWRRANEGTYESGDEIDEPSVYALIPPAWLACTGLTTLQAPAQLHADLKTFDEGQVSFFGTVINDFNPNPNADELIPYKTDYEPWLYDRAQVFFNGYIRTGKLEFLREAHRATVHYMKLLYVKGSCPSSLADKNCVGFFGLKNPADSDYKDSKYSYNESLVTHYWLSGDPEPLKHLADVISATAEEVNIASVPTPTSWFTERHFANALLAPVMAFEVTGDPQTKTLIVQGIDALETLQNNPWEGSRNGCFNSYVEGGERLSFSPWMSSLIAHALLRAYHVTADARIPKMLVDLAQCEVDLAIYYPDEQGAPEYWMSYYIAAAFGDPKGIDSDPWSDLEHAIDTAYVTALGAYFSQDATQKSALVEATKNLLATHSYVLDYWTRPGEWPQNGRPLYRVAPPRKYSWWYKNSGAIGWALFGAPSFP